MNDTIFARSSDTVSDDFDDFFKWVPRKHYNAFTNPDDAVLFALVQVTPDLIAEYRATVLPPNPAPAVGHYVLYFDGNGDVYAYAYGEDMAAALADYQDAAQVDFFGEDQGPF